jgi:hypothetical protein
LPDRIVDVGDDDRCARIAQRLDCRRAEPGCTTCDERAGSGKFHDALLNDEAAARNNTMPL